MKRERETSNTDSWLGCSTVSEETKENIVRVCVGGHGRFLNLLNNSNTLKVIVRSLSLRVKSPFCKKDGGGRAGDSADARADAAGR